MKVFASHPWGRTEAVAGESTCGFMKKMNPQADLVEVIRASDTVGHSPSPLNGRQQKADQHRCNGNYHQQFDQCKSSVFQQRNLSRRMIPCMLW